MSFAVQNILQISEVFLMKIKISYNRNCRNIFSKFSLTNLIFFLDLNYRNQLPSLVTPLLYLISFKFNFFFKFSGHEAEVEGTLSVQPQAHPVIGFEEYFLNLTVKTNTRNPWFVGKSSIHSELCFST